MTRPNRLDTWGPLPGDCSHATTLVHVECCMSDEYLPFVSPAICCRGGCYPAEDRGSLATLHVPNGKPHDMARANNKLMSIIPTAVDVSSPHMSVPRQRLLSQSPNH